MRSTASFKALGTVSLVAAGAAFSSVAGAHISLDQAGTHLSRYGDAYLKDGPCGKAGGTRGENVYGYKGGEKVEVAITEFIPHPSYFRIAFDDDGDDDFAPPASIEPIDPNRPCPLNDADKCGEPDYYNNGAVLSKMDDLEPHMTAAAGTKYSWNVEMPNVSCDNCTLQIIQVMEDTIHGAYNPVRGDPNDVPYVADIYYQCIDLTLTKTGRTTTGVDSSKNEKASGCAVRPGTTVSGVPGVLAALVLGGLSLRRRGRASPA